MQQTDRSYKGGKHPYFICRFAGTDEPALPEFADTVDEMEPAVRDFPVPLTIRVVSLCQDLMRQAPLSVGMHGADARDRTRCLCRYIRNEFAHKEDSWVIAAVRAQNERRAHFLRDFPIRLQK